MKTYLDRAKEAFHELEEVTEGQEDPDGDLALLRFLGYLGLSIASSLQRIADKYSEQT